MNQNKKVVVFTLSATFILLVYSCLITYSKSEFLGTDKISIVSDIIYDKAVNIAVYNDTTDAGMTIEDVAPHADTADTAAVATAKTERKQKVVHSPVARVHETPVEMLQKTNKNFASYTSSRVLNSFSKDTAKPALPDFMKKLVALKKGKREKVRIAWFGDSMIEGDLLTKTFRKRMQQFFGGYGVGFVPATSVTAPFRNTVVHKWKGDWKEESFKTSALTQPLFLSGHTFFTSNGELILTDKTVPDTNQILEKSLICGEAPGQVELLVNGQLRHYKANRRVNRLLLDTTNRHNVDVVVNNGRLPVYGISIEPRTGIVVDNFSFRGITGLELGKLDSAMLGSLDGDNGYDLVILEYGANLMFRPDDVDYSWYRRHIINVLAKLQKAMPHAEFLVISTADRAFNYNNKWRTATGIDNLVKTQAELAYRNDVAFYNMYKSMGGAGTIVHWADSSPAMANKDYVHPNFLGADFLGNMLYDAFMKDFRKAGGTSGI